MLQRRTPVTVVSAGVNGNPKVDMVGPLVQNLIRKAASLAALHS